MTGKRSSGPSSLMLSKTDAVPAELRDGIRELTDLYTPEEERKKGHAGMLMRKVCTEADKNGLVLLLRVDSNIAMINESLIEFYANNGFQVIQQTPIIMARQANG